MKTLIGLMMALGSLTTGALADPNTTAFTYQGELTAGGSRVSTPVDLRFRLYDTASGGLQVGALLGSSGVTPVEGRFSVSLDFGSGVFTGQRRWLQVEVSPAGSGVYTPLSPRQELASAPFASYALNIPAQYATFTDAGGSAVFTTGNVGVGTAAPTAGLHVTRTGAGGMAMNVTDRLYVSEGQAFVGVNRTTRVSPAETFGLQNTPAQTGYTGMYIKSTSVTGLPFYGYNTPGATGWTQLDNGGVWSLFLAGAARLAVTSPGDVGIGTTAPSARLDVVGTARATQFQFGDGSVQTRAALDPGDTGVTTGLAATARYRVLVNGVEQAGVQLFSNPSIYQAVDGGGNLTGARVLETVIKLRRSSAAGTVWYNGFVQNQAFGPVSVELTQSGVPGSTPRVVWGFGVAATAGWRTFVSDDGAPVEEVTLWFDPTQVTRTVTGVFTPGLPSAGARNGVVAGSGALLRAKLGGALLTGSVVSPEVEQTAPIDGATGQRTGRLRCPTMVFRTNASETVGVFASWAGSALVSFDAVSWTSGSQTVLFTYAQSHITRWALVRTDDGGLVEEFRVTGVLPPP